MIIRYLLFLTFIILFIIFSFVLLKDLGDDRKKIEKAVNMEKIKEQTIWQKGPKHKR